MKKQLTIDYACHTEMGLKAEYADAADGRTPPDDLLLSKGVAAVIADGMSSSEGAKRPVRFVSSAF
ncbi:MAG: hypothetical protein GY934_09505 [Gammaproteobacteria bacterium]|nr:hypothetical protein [Gammaproteobacteria bacterium]